MYCSKCGQKCDEGASYCKNCGYFLQQGEPLKGGAVRATKAKKKKNSSIGIVWRGLALALLIALVLALVLWLTGVFSAQVGLTGSWTSEDGSVSMVFDDAGFVDIRGGEGSVIGAYTFDAKSGQALIYYERGGEPVEKEFVLIENRYMIDGTVFERD